MEEIVLVCPSCSELVMEFPLTGGAMKWQCSVHGLTSFPIEEKHLVNRVGSVVSPPMSSTVGSSVPVVDSLETVATLRAWVERTEYKLAIAKRFIDVMEEK